MCVMRSRVKSKERPKGEKLSAHCKFIGGEYNLLHLSITTRQATVTLFLICSVTLNSSGILIVLYGNH